MARASTVELSACLSATLVCCLPLLSSPAIGEPVCDADAICIDEDRIDDTTRLVVENRTEFPLTYTIRVRTRNMSSGGPTKITRTLPGGETDVAFELIATGGGSPARYRFSYDWTVGDKDAIHNEDYLYRLPYAEGESYRVIQGFGSRFSHTGLEQFAIDFLMVEGTPVHAARDGVVARVEERHSKGCWEDGCGKYANYVVVLHDDGTTGEYYHLKQNGALVDVGERVYAGQKIALSGNTGHTTVPHLHFAVYRAADWGNTQSVPIRFASADGIVDRPRRGGRYQAISATRYTRTRNQHQTRTALKSAGGE